MNKNEFGEFIRSKRLEQGLTQKALAERLYLSESAISKWEMGKSYPDITLIPALCEILGVSEHELIAGANDTESRRIRQEAHWYRLICESLFRGLTGAYLLALAICLLCDLIRHHTLTYVPTVFGALLVAFTFAPTCTRFTKQHKLAVFAGSTYAALVLLFVICSIQSRQTWWSIAAAGTLTGYVVIFAPPLLRRYLPEKLRSGIVPIFFALLLVTLFLLLCVIRCTVEFPLLRGCLMLLYAFMPPTALSAMCLTRSNNLLRAAVTTLTAGLILYGTPWVAGRLFGQSTSDNYTVNFFDWQTCINGNIALLTLAGCIAAAGILFLIGMRKSK